MKLTTTISLNFGIVSWISVQLIDWNGVATIASWYIPGCAMIKARSLAKRLQAHS